MNKGANDEQKKEREIRTKKDIRSNYVVLIQAKDRPDLMIDTQGFPYARYASLAFMHYSETKKGIEEDERDEEEAKEWFENERAAGRAFNQEDMDKFPPYKRTRKKSIKESGADNF